MDDSLIFNLSVTGNTREMHPIAKDEVYRIGREAIRNACRHSAGKRIDIELVYDHNMLLRIGDDSRGIDANTLRAGKTGHYGLTGMRERAQSIGAKLTVASSTRGTNITLFVPGGVIYAPAAAGRLARLANLFRWSKTPHQL
jgi:signal transduction histidine kinase